MRYVIISFLLVSLSVHLIGQSLPEYVENQLIVKFSKDIYSTFQSAPLDQPLELTNDIDIIGLFTSLDVTKLERLHPLEEFSELGIKSGMNREFVLYYSQDIKVPDAILSVIQNRDIEEAAPNHLYYVEVVPNDQYYSNQWSLSKISMPEAWDLQQGDVNIRIAILDVGFKLDHSDLSSKFSATYKRDETDIITQSYTDDGFTLISGEDYTTTDNNPTSKGTHGTHVAGISGASTNNSAGVAGVGWNNILVPVRCGFQIISPQFSSVGVLETDDWIRALDWVRNNSVAKVVNMSFGRSYSGGSNPSEQTAINNALNAGIVICASSGNSNLSNVGYPAAYSGVIAVGATNENDNRCSPSDWGTGFGSNYGSQLSIVAPGNNIYSTYFDGSGNSTYQYLDGTSMASPHVAGAAALLLSNNSNLSPVEIKSILEGTATKVTGMSGQNFHVEYGYGRLNVEQALMNVPLTFQFVNNIQSTENHGELIIDDDLNNPVSSTTYMNFTPGTDHQVRTDELPFILNWSGTTQKSNRWYINNSDYNLNLEFTANANEPSKKDARFEATEPATVKNYLSEVGNYVGEVELKDPWYYYQSQGNWFQSNEFKSYPSPFNIQNNSTNSYGGIFLNQPYTGSNPVHYSLRVLLQDINLSQTGKTHKFYWQNWSYDPDDVSLETPTSNESAVVFKTSDATITAELKGTQLSNNSGAYSNNSQRKFVRTDDGVLHNVYESLGRVWYETSTDGGDTWFLANGGLPLDNGEGKQPSIDYALYEGSLEDYYQIFIVFQEKYGSNSIIKIKYFQSVGPGGPYLYTYEEQIGSENGDYYTKNTTPVIGAYTSNFTVVWKTNNNLYGRAGYINFNNDEIILYTGNSLTNTTSSSINPSISVSKSSSPVKNLVWEESNSIKFASLSGSQISGSITTVSSSSGYSSNNKPSISFYQSYPVVSWLATENITLIQKALLRIKFSGGWGTLYSYGYSGGDNVSNLSVNSTSAGDFVLAWGGDQANKYITSKSTTNIYALTTSGDVQTANADALSNINVMSFVNSSSPYSFTSSTITQGLSKGTNSSYVSREVIARLGTTEYYYSFGDISVDEDNINFVEIEDSLFAQNKNSADNYLITEPFNLTDNSSLKFTIEYGTIDSAASEANNILFKLELIEAETMPTAGKPANVLGVLNEASTEENGLLIRNNNTYTINSKGIGNKTVRLRVRLGDMQANDYMIVTNVSTGETLAKTGESQELAFNGEAVITDYSLFQNYPNPFNPTTTITYQMPQDGFVTLKIYDVLGNKVSTLVNEYKATGSYNINYYASSLSSGVYIYSIRVNDYSATKKFVLMK